MAIDDVGLTVHATGNVGGGVGSRIGQDVQKPEQLYMYQNSKQELTFLAKEKETGFPSETSSWFYRDWIYTYFDTFSATKVRKVR